VYRRQTLSDAARAHALAQRDWLTTGQADQLGLTKDVRTRLVNDGHWHRRESGLYDTAPGHDALEKRIWAAALSVGEPCAIGGEAALFLWGLQRAVGQVVVWVPDDRRPRSGERALVRRDKIDRTGRACGDPRRISVEDALIDVGQRLSMDALVQLVSDCLRLNLTTIARVRGALGRRRRVRARDRFTEMLDDLEGVESTLEWAYRRDVERAHRLPPGRRQVSVSPGTRTDVLYEEAHMLIELDGRVGHEDAASAFRDLRRDNNHAIRNYLTLRYGSADVRGRPCEVARQVWQAMAARGWAEPFRPCPRCR
jgi:hypothetical protein